VIAGLLHDSAENTDTPLQAVRDRFGDRVADLVDAVTNREGEDADASAQRAARAGRDALYLRLCDRLDGVRRSPGRKPAAREKFLAASREVHLVLAGEHFPRLAGALRQALSDAAGS